MNARVDRHFPYSVWEDYAMGVLSEQDSAPVEEHLLICPRCQDLLAEADEYIEIMKAAMSPAKPPEKGDQPIATEHETRRRLSKAAAAAATLTALLPL